jgi:hypothetical protein
VKFFFDETNFNEHLKVAQSLRKGYEIHRSNYTAEIKSPYVNVSFIQAMQTERAMIAAACIRKDVLASGSETPAIDQRDLTYFSFAPNEILSKVKETVYLIDIKQAYATVLRNKQLITEKTAKFVQGLEKKDRLAAVGMLAANKYIYKFDENNELLNPIINVKKKTAPFFYLCIKEVSEVMDRIKLALGKDFIFYWVDGIYFNNKKHAQEIGRILTEANFNYTFEELKNFRIWQAERNYLLTYWQERETLCKKKFLPCLSRTTTPKRLCSI